MNKHNFYIEFSYRVSLYSIIIRKLDNVQEIIINNYYNILGRYNNSNLFLICRHYFTSDYCYVEHD